MAMSSHLIPNKANVRSAADPGATQSFAINTELRYAQQQYPSMVDVAKTPLPTAVSPDKALGIFATPLTPANQPQTSMITDGAFFAQ